MFCCFCGKEIPDNARFCSYCGKDITDAENAVERQDKGEIIAEEEKSIPKDNTTGLLSMNRFIIDEKISFLTFANAYAIYDDSGETVGAVQQVNISGGAKAARLLLGSTAKRLQSFQLNVMDNSGKVIAVIKREGVGSGFSSLRSISVYDGKNNVLGTLENKILYDENGMRVGQIQFDSFFRSSYTLYDSSGDSVLARINKQWNGIGKELFTTADKYLVEINEAPDPKNKTLIIATAITVDMIYHEV